MIFIFFVEGGGGGGGVLGILIGGSELEWEMQRTKWGDRRGALCTGFTLVLYNESKHNFLRPIKQIKKTQLLLLFTPTACLSSNSVGSQLQTSVRWFSLFFYVLFLRQAFNNWPKFLLLFQTLREVIRVSNF